jgi:CRP-like cAMP-binding protein
MTFGELAVLGRSTRSADVHADGPAEVRVLPAAGFDALGTTHPGLKAALLQNLLAGAYEAVGRMTREVASLGLGR